jgi:hypothetical protein
MVVHKWIVGISGVDYWSGVMVGWIGIGRVMGRSPPVIRIYNSYWVEPVIVLIMTSKIFVIATIK